MVLKAVVGVLALGVAVGAGAVDGRGTGTWGDVGVPAVAQDSVGRAIFVGKGMCQACHGPAGKGTPLAPDLTDAEWLNVEGTLEQVIELVKKGVAKPKKHPAPMPPMGGGQLTDEEVAAVSRYVLSLSAGG